MVAKSRSELKSLFLTSWLRITDRPAPAEQLTEPHSPAYHPSPGSLGCHSVASALLQCLISATKSAIGIHNFESDMQSPFQKPFIFNGLEEQDLLELTLP